MYEWNKAIHSYIATLGTAEKLPSNFEFVANSLNAHLNSSQLKLFVLSTYEWFFTDSLHFPVECLPFHGFSLMADLDAISRSYLREDSGKNFAFFEIIVLTNSKSTKL